MKRLPFPSSEYTRDMMPSLFPTIRHTKLALILLRIVKREMLEYTPPNYICAAISRAVVAYWGTEDSREVRYMGGQLHALVNYQLNGSGTLEGWLLTHRRGNVDAALDGRQHWHQLVHAGRISWLRSMIYDLCAHGQMQCGLEVKP